MAAKKTAVDAFAGNASSSDVTSDSTCCEDHHGESQGTHRLPTVFDIVKSGMLVPFQTVVETSGPGILRSRDEKGHTPAHWACLGGHSTILRYIIEMKGYFDEPSENELRQHPVHWACVNGHIGIIEILLQAGVNIDVVDGKGCTPLIVACQYGKTVLCGYLLGKGARQQVLDKDGDTALHWAAFKGHSELMRLLIYSGFNPHQKDNYGQTPLHLACINGNLTAVQELCEQDNVEIGLDDKNGKTPLMLATGRKHDAVVTYLKKTAKRKSNYFQKIDIWAVVFGPPGNTKGPLLFFVINMLFWAYPMYVIKCLPMTWVELQPLHIIFMMLNVVMWVSLYHAATIDPGYLPRNIPEYDRAIKEVAHFDEWKHGRNPLSRLCHTCRTVKPLRSKHCRICNRCVRQFDHHCPYIYNCVGIKNRAWFFAFVLVTLINALISLYLCKTMVRLGGFDWLTVLAFGQLLLGTAISGLVVTCSGDFHRFHGVVHTVGVSFTLFTFTFLLNGLLALVLVYYVWVSEGTCWYLVVGVVEGLVFLAVAAFVGGATVYHAVLNLTTNERINYKRYDYLKDGKGKYYNPYNRGFKNNLLEFLHLKQAISDEDVQFLNVAVV